VEEAAGRAGRDPSEVRIVAVTKGHPPDAVRAAVDVGLGDVGENRVGELERKVGLLGRGLARWHMIGHVQRRKASRLPGLTDLLHSLDSFRLAERLQRVGEDAGTTIPVLVQVNTSGEASKYGFSPDEFRESFAGILALDRLRVDGLMTMAPLTEDEGLIRRTFRSLRELHRESRERPAYEGTELSMGMSNDYGIAVEEGSTMIRVGTALFGERPQ